MPSQILIPKENTQTGLTIVSPIIEGIDDLPCGVSTNPEEVKINAYEKELSNLIDDLPHIIKDVCQRYSSSDEQIMALYSLITLTGSLLPNVRINYNNKINYPALMLLIIYPPASGKGCLSSIRKLVSKINTELIDQNNILLREYKLKCDQYKKSLKSDSTSLPPQKPNLPMLLIPGDVTSAKLIEQLSQNGPEQALMIFETEADAFGISSSNKQYGAQISTVLRKSFEFESVSQARKTEGELLITETPKLAMVLSGTENQITKIFTSNEDGLYSRFLIVTGGSSPKWMDVKPDLTKETQDSYFEAMADEFYKIWKFFIGKTIEVKLTDMQWGRINAFGTTNLAMTHHFKGESTGSIAKRHANMIARIASILTMFKYFDNRSEIPTAYCDDKDFNAAIWMVEQSLGWSLDIYKKLPEKIKNEVPKNKLSLLNSLPKEFTLIEVPTLVPSITLSVRTLSRWVKEFVDSGYLTRLQHGKYEKTYVAYLAVAEVMNSSL